ncbi:MAG: substrate binding domain-containing protein, partial [Pseudomonadota bacterium]
RMTLTEAGQNYLDAVEGILESIAEADAQASQTATEVRGRLRLNVPVSFGIREVAPLVPKLVEQYPKLDIDLGLNDRQVNLIEEGWDLAIRIGELRDSSMIARRLAPCSMVICASPNYLKQFGEPKEIADLKQHNCLGYTLSDRVGTNRWHFGSEGTKSVAISGNIQANNGDVLVKAALEGQGIVYQPTFLVREELNNGSLIALELDHATMELDGIFAVYPADRRPPAKLRATIDFFVDAFSPVPRWEFC